MGISYNRIFESKKDPSNKLHLVKNDKIYHFGVLCSTMQNAWMRALAMRVKSDFSFYCNPRITASLDLSSRPISTGLTSAQVVLDECAKIVNASNAVGSHMAFLIQRFQQFISSLQDTAKPKERRNL